MGEEASDGVPGVRVLAAGDVDVGDGDGMEGRGGVRGEGEEIGKSEAQEEEAAAGGEELNEVEVI